MKKSKNLFLLLPIFLLAFTNCEDKEVSSTEWSIPSDEVFDGGPGKDGIPSVDDPKFALTTATDYLGDNDLVLGIQIGNEIKAYTHPVLDWHEIVNDEIGGVPVAITYCPLTGTGIGWDRTIDGEVTEFGVSGLLYNSNLIPYDRKTDSNWSQMANECVNGNLLNTPIQTHLMVETTWKTWKEMFPNSQVLTTDTGINRNYGTYPYGSYRTSGSLNFPISITDDRLHVKERVLGVLINGNAKAYQFEKFEGEDIGVIEDSFEGKNLVIVGSEEKNFMVAFDRDFNGSMRTFTALQNELPIVMQDELGNKYDFFGKVIEGPNVGEVLESPTNYIGYWFSWGTFYQDTEIYE